MHCRPLDVFFTCFFWNFEVVIWIKLEASIGQSWKLHSLSDKSTLVIKFYLPSINFNMSSELQGCTKTSDSEALRLIVLILFDALAVLLNFFVVSAR